MSFREKALAEKGRILVVDDEQGMRQMLDVFLEKNGYAVVVASSGEEGIRLLGSGKDFDLVITDLLMQKMGGIELLQEVKKIAGDTEVIVITAYGTTDTAVEAMKQGAYDYITKPFNLDEFRIVVEQAIERRRLKLENLALRERVEGRYSFRDIIGRSAAMQRVIDVCRKVADSKTTVLLSGESGTGKEMVARAIHFAGERASGPFIVVNCGALPETLMESELFGHVKGAFTGAVHANEGLFRAAHGGTIFLDEVGEIPLATQVKLLRALQEKKVRPVGGDDEIVVDVRVISATNKDLEVEVKAGLFRDDLYYRINVIRIPLPSLRERREDIPLLIDFFLRRFAREQGMEMKALEPQAFRTLMGYDFPGNVRELANIIERAVTLTSGPFIGLDLLALPLPEAGPSETLIKLPPDGMALDEYLSRIERGIILQALEQTGWVKKKAADLLKTSFRSFRYKLEKLDIDKDVENHHLPE